MADPIIIAEIVKNSRETLRVTLDQFNGHDLISLRVFFEAADGSWRPGRSGLACRVELLPQLSEAIAAAVEKAKELGLVDGGAG